MQCDYAECWDIIAGRLRRHGQRLRVAGEYDGVDSLLAAVESGLGVALITTRSARRVPERVRLKALLARPEPLRIAAGHRTDGAGDQPLTAFVAELRTAAAALA